MEKQVFLRYPYTMGTFVRTAREDGLTHALKEDWAMTKRNIEYDVRDTVLYSLVTLAIPIVIGAYIAKKITNAVRNKGRPNSLEFL